MIVSFQHRFIFIAIPKTAGHAIRKGLRELLGPKDWEQCSLFEEKRFPNPEIAQLGHGHITARQIAEHLPTSSYRDFYSFAFVRNPYDRFVSFCSFIHRDNDVMIRKPLQTMKSILRNKRMHQQILMRPQHEFICNKDGDVMINHLAHFENIQSEFNNIMRHFNQNDYQLPRINESLHADFRDYYDSALEDEVYHFYKKDFELLGYDRELLK